MALSHVKTNKGWYTWWWLAIQGDTSWRTVIHKVNCIDQQNIHKNESFIKEYPRNTVELLNPGALSICKQKARWQWLPRAQKFDSRFILYSIQYKLSNEKSEHSWTPCCIVRLLILDCKWLTMYFEA